MNIFVVCRPNWLYFFLFERAKYKVFSVYYKFYKYSWKAITSGDYMITYIFLKSKTTKCLQHFYFAYISVWENDKILIFFPKDAPWKALLKMHKQILFTFSGGFFPYTIWTTYMVVLLPGRIKIIGRRLCFAITQLV